MGQEWSGGDLVSFLFFLNSFIYHWTDLKQNSLVSVTIQGNNRGIFIDISLTF